MPGPSGRPTHGERRRRAILDAAVDVGSAEGLESLSLGRLANEIGMSKSGLFAHFGSKQDLQLATIERAAEDFEREVMARAESADPGRLRLAALVEAWITYVEGIRFRGGCFFFATSAEFGSRPGPVRELLARSTGKWLRALEREARVAVRQSEFGRDIDPARLAFDLHAFVQEANWARELLEDGEAFDRARAAIDETLCRASRTQAIGVRHADPHE